MFPPMSELCRVERLRCHPANARVGNVDGIAESIRVNGFFGTIVAQRSTGYILAGNHRFRAAVQVGLAELPVQWIDVDDEQARRIMLADNRLSDLGGHDERKLLALLADLEQSSQQLAGTGYAQEDVDALISRLDEQANGFFAEFHHEANSLGDRGVDGKATELWRESHRLGTDRVGQATGNHGLPDEIGAGSHLGKQRFAGDQSAQLVARFQILITCRDEREQLVLLDQLSNAGHDVRALIA